MSYILVNNQSQLDKAVRTAAGGDTIVLDSSFQNARIAVYGFNKAGGLTITSDAAGQATVSGLSLGNSSGVKVQNLDVSLPVSKFTPVLVNGCTNIELFGLHVHGFGDSFAKMGMNIQNSTGVSLKGSKFDHLNGAVNFSRNNNISLTENDISYIRDDGFIGTQSSGVKIQNNYFHEWRHSGDIHPDCIQLFTMSGGIPSNNIDISGNVINRGNGTPVQGIFISNISGKESFNNLSITRNAVIGESYNGLYLNEVQSASVSGNIVQGYSDRPSWIGIFGATSSAQVAGNIAADYNFNGANANFHDNLISDRLPIAGLGAITSAIENLAAKTPPAMLFDATQTYLGSISERVAASNLQGAGESASLAVAGSVADLLKHPDLVRLHGAQVTGANVVTLGQELALLASGAVSLADHASITVQMSMAELRSAGGYRAVHSAVTAGVELIGDATITTSDVAMLNALPALSIGPNAHLNLADWGSNFTKSLDAVEQLAASGAISGVKLLDQAATLKLTDTQYKNDAHALALLANPAKLAVTVASGHSATARDSLATLDGSAGSAVLTASDGGNTLIGGSGDTLIGGAGRDTFVLHGHFGQETVTGFGATDVLQFDRAAVSDFRHLLTHMHQVGGDVVVDLGAGDLVTLAELSLTSLNAGNFTFL